MHVWTKDICDPPPPHTLTFERMCCNAVRQDMIQLSVRTARTCPERQACVGGQEFGCRKLSVPNKGIEKCVADRKIIFGWEWKSMNGPRPRPAITKPYPKDGRSKSNLYSACQTKCLPVTCPPVVHTHRLHRGWCSVAQLH